MATYFGEVLPVYSRAVDEDDDEETESVDFCSATIKWNPEIKGTFEVVNSGNPLPCLSMLIAIGPAASGFAHTFMLNTEYEVVAALESGFSDDADRLFKRSSPTDKCCQLYRTQQCPSRFLCVCNSTVSPEQSFSWTSQLFEHMALSEAEVVILSTSAVSEYRSEIPSSDLTAPFVRALKSQSYTGTPFCPYLEQPNVVPGLPAQILSHLHIQKVKAVLYQCYSDTIFLDSRTIKAFKPVLSMPPFKDTVKANPKADEMLKKIVNMNTTSNTLYL